MKTTKIQMNATTFKATRDILCAYFSAKQLLAEEKDKFTKRAKSVRECIANDEDELVRLLMGDTDGIIRDRATIETSLAANKATLEKYVKPYTVMEEKCADAISKAEGLFNNKDSALYKAYVAYVVDTTDDNYNAYADAMCARFKELGLADATPDNVAHFMPNTDRDLKGSTAVKNGDIQGALNVGAFAKGVLRKFYVQNKDAFRTEKFRAYVLKCAEKAKKSTK